MCMREWQRKERVKESEELEWEGGREIKRIYIDIPFYISLSMPLLACIFNPSAWLRMCLSVKLSVFVLQIIISFVKFCRFLNQFPREKWLVKHDFHWFLYKQTGILYHFYLFYVTYTFRMCVCSWRSITSYTFHL